jgi:hypothetical protein
MAIAEFEEGTLRIDAAVLFIEYAQISVRVVRGPGRRINYRRSF